MKKVPEFKTDQEAEAFLEQDLSDLDFSQFKPMPFEIARKEAALHMRIPLGLWTHSRPGQPAREFRIPAMSAC